VILACGHREVEDRTVSLRRLGEKETRVETLETVLEALGRDALAPDLL